MYQPKMAEDLIMSIYQLAKKEGIPMTRVLDKLLRDALKKKGALVELLPEDE